MYPGTADYWSWLAGNVSEVALDVKSKIEADTKKKYILIAAGFVAAAAFLLLFGKRGR